MAPGPKTKRAPQTWASCQKPSAKSNTGGGASASSRGEDMLCALGLGEQPAPSSEGVLPSGQAAKKRLPPRDACEEVLEEHMASVRRRNASVAPEPDASTRELPPPRSDSKIPEGGGNKSMEDSRQSDRDRSPSIPVCTYQSPDVDDAFHEEEDDGRLPHRSTRIPSPIHLSRRPKPTVNSHRRPHDDSVATYPGGDCEDWRRDTRVRHYHRSSRSPSLDRDHPREERHFRGRHRRSSYSDISSSPERRRGSTRDRPRHESPCRRRSSLDSNHRRSSFRGDEDSSGRFSFSRSRNHSSPSDRDRERRRSSLSPLTPTGPTLPTPSRPSTLGSADDDTNSMRNRQSSQRQGELSLAGPRTARLLSGLPLKVDSVQRQGRREGEASRDEDAAQREQRGKRPHLVNVNSEGRPYGLGVTAFNDALSKIVRGLDPSYVDIRQQPFHLMEVLLRRLEADFDYSEPLNPTWLRTRIGSALSSYRHELIRMIQMEQERPMWVDETIWRKLVQLEGSEKFRVKSEQMRYANSCRRSKGRTGPLGEAGITERLRRQLRRSPTSEEVYDEMHRDKGYGGRSRKVPLPVTSRSVTASAAGSKQSGETGAPHASKVASDTHGQEAQPEDQDGIISANTPLPLDIPSDATDPKVQSSGSNCNPIEDIIWKEIDDLIRSSVSDTPDGVKLIQTLRSQLEVLRQKNVSSTSNDGPPPTSRVTSNPEVVHIPPVTSAAEDSIPVDTMTEKAAPVSVPEDVPHDAVEEPIRRRSGRPAKKKVREY